MDDPIQLFKTWLEEAKAVAEIREPTAMSVATISPEGKPENRMLLLKGADERGFVFYTNLGSPKAKALSANPQVALCFYWMPLGKQIRVTGPVTPVSDAEADEYFASRPRLSQLGAWASRQSEEMGGYYELEAEVAKVALRFGVGKVPRPPFWSGFRLAPERIEFWKEKPFRRHERFVFKKTAEGWSRKWLFP
jgi:pyridoxamine 5'-phosphate oxidase